jgi:hypothetical protein
MTTKALTLDQAGAQSLTTGLAGTALLAVERARAGSGDPVTAARLVQQVTQVPVDGGTHGSLYYGAPTVGVLLHAAGPLHPALQAWVSRIDEHVLTVVRSRLTAAATQPAPATFTDFDLLYGLAGLGSYLLHHLPGTDELTAVLDHVVVLTHDRRHAGTTVPGWWVDTDPDTIVTAPGGHGNNGMAHGAAGLLALLSRAAVRGHRVGGHLDAIHRLLAWFDRWQYDTWAGTAWPEWITLPELRTGAVRQHRHPVRPSWCYGPVGIGRAQQLAALAVGDSRRLAFAEKVLAQCVSPAATSLIADAGICHGTAGLDQTLFRAAADMTDPGLRALVTGYLDRRAATERPAGSDDAGFLTGDAGVSLVHDTLAAATAPSTGWDTCLLLI